MKQIYKHYQNNQNKHKYTKSETEQLLSPEEINILNTEPTTNSAKHTNKSTW